jgi:cytochrome P450
VLTDPDFVPFEPPPQPLGLRGLPTLGRNYVEAIPRAAYEEKVVRIDGALSDLLLVCDPDIVGEILVDKPDAFERDVVTRRSFAPMIGPTSLFLAEGADWRWQRRAVAPIFRHDMLLSFVPIFSAMAQRQIERWRAAPRDQAVDAAAAMTRTTFEIIVEVMLGGSASLDSDRYSRALTENFNTIPWHVIYALFSLPPWLPFPKRGRAMRERDFLHRDIRRIVAARRAAPSAQPDLLDLLLAARDPETGRTMTDTEVMTNLLTFIIAGHETTSVALAWTLWLLAKDQAVQQRVVDEVTAVSGSAAIGGAHVEGLTFSRQVIQEAMRLFPPAPHADQPENPRPHSGLRLASQCPALGSSQRLRSRSLRAGSGQGAFALCLPAVRRRTAHLYWGELCHHRSRGTAGELYSRLSYRSGSRP